MGEQVKTHLLWPEKYLKLPEGLIETEYDDGILTLESKHFIKGVELLVPGVSGAVFSDNYFDLVPGEQIKIKVLESKGGKEITIKGINSSPLSVSL